MDKISQAFCENGYSFYNEEYIRKLLECASKLPPRTIDSGFLVDDNDIFDLDISADGRYNSEHRRLKAEYEPKKSDKQIIGTRINEVRTRKSRYEHKMFAMCGNKHNIEHEDKPNKKQELEKFDEKFIGNKHNIEHEDKPNKNQKFDSIEQ
jgi:hypothetical protein